MKVYHHNDHDGRCSAAIVWNTLRDNFDTTLVKEKEDSIIKFFEVNYPVGRDIDPPGINHIERDEKIYILDFSFSEDYIHRIMEVTKNITWIDHHKTSIGFNYAEKIDTVLSLDKAACMLTWEYFHNEETPPIAVSLIQAWDIWNLDYSQYVEPFKEGLYLYDHGPFDPIWNTLLSREKEIHKPTPKWLEIAEKGEICLQYRRKKNENYIDEYAFEIDFEGYKCIVCCGRSEGSKMFGDKLNNYDMGITFAYNGSNWIVSLYAGRKDIDVSKIAKKRGGGGHKGAAGFTTKTPPAFLLGILDSSIY